MRTLLLAGIAIVSLAGLSAGSANAADLYDPGPPGYTQVPPPAYEAPPPNYAPPPSRYGYVPPPAYEPPPVYAPPRVYGPPPAVAYDDDDEVIVAPPRPRYRGYAERPHRLDCWWEWGERRCAPRRGW
jgi:hypothetical protein